eukprot:gnl/TRDRNA2_/TRDRNA2_190659_c0_seq1.p1 gnl/TRDRNA2_/TRDRNA2_190659_c0~~gnl/TRDRNA2_/TRDRNA2_190659_c0_seq1.p1  ORF type:complete len:441 (-),score=59.36 gnl/TRDRNA2_/TRDRNA2_190659_c0_seq1:102-1424(-)
MTCDVHIAGQDLYAVLNLKPWSDMSDVGTAYRHAALRVHPDKPGGSAESFHLVTLAFEILSCPDTRHLYDQARAKMLRQEKLQQRRRQRQDADSCASRNKNRRPRVTSTSCTSTPSVRLFLTSRTSSLKRPAPQPARTVRAKRLCKVAPQHDAKKSAVPLTQMDAALEQVRIVLQSMTRAKRLEAVSGMVPHIQKELLNFMEQRQRVPDVIAGTEGRSRSREPRRDCWIRGTGVRKLPGSKLFQAHLAVKALRLYTRGQTDIEIAIKHQMILVGLRQAMNAATAANATIWDDPAQLQGMCTTFFESHGTTASKLGLSVFVTLRAPGMIGNRFNISSPVLPLAEALAVHSRLLNARNQSWDMFRAAWVELMQRAKHQKKGLSLADAEDFADGARNAFLEERLVKAVWAVQKVLTAGKHQEANSRAIAAQPWGQRAIAATAA